MAEPTLATETWRPVVDYEGFYEASDLGQVRSVDRTYTCEGRWGKPHLRTYRGRIIAPQLVWDGHLRLMLSVRGRKKLFPVHILVLEAFAGRRPVGYLGCHNDGNPANNVLTNLRWGTPSSNSIDRVTHGNHYEANKTRCPRKHRLVEPNLVKSQSARGYRSCLACARAIGHAPVDSPEFVWIADRFYRQIMSSPDVSTLPVGNDQLATS